MLTVFIIGGGAGGSSLLEHLVTLKGVQILGIADINPEAPALPKARGFGIPVTIGQLPDHLETWTVDLVFDLTGDPAMHDRLLKFPNPAFHLVTGECTHLILKMIQELEEKDLQMRLKYEEHRILTEISMAIALSKTSNEIFDAIVNGGMEITGTPMGSLSIFHPDRKELFLVAAKGFSSGFYVASRYEVRPGGLTEHILSQKEPLVVPNISDHPAFNNPILLKEGIKSLIALPLNSDQGPVGILYVDDFEPRVFSQNVIEVLKLLAIQATIAIQKQQAFEKIKALSMRDPVTGLFNRRYFNDILAAEMDRAYRMSSPLAVIIFDIDHFKGINDHYGHMTGDQVLKDMTTLFKSMLRRNDAFCRFGGDEMLILTSETDMRGAFRLAERLRFAAENARFLPDKRSVTCSFGINAIYGNETYRQSPDDFVSRADQALYDAKAQGRNRVVSPVPSVNFTPLNP
jgi:diguanylate cyclase (GGDEF)-like protein